VLHGHSACLRCIWNQQRKEKTHKQSHMYKPLLAPNIQGAFSNRIARADIRLPAMAVASGIADRSRQLSSIVKQHDPRMVGCSLRTVCLASAVTTEISKPPVARIYYNGLKLQNRISAAWLSGWPIGPQGVSKPLHINGPATTLSNIEWEGMRCNGH
jgi:hypothetical protein